MLLTRVHVGVVETDPGDRSARDDAEDERVADHAILASLLR
jgi:hypothetical protein